MMPSEIWKRLIINWLKSLTLGWSGVTTFLSSREKHIQWYQEGKRESYLEDPRIFQTKKIAKKAKIMVIVDDALQTEYMWHRDMWWSCCPHRGEVLCPVVLREHTTKNPECFQRTGPNLIVRSTQTRHEGVLQTINSMIKLTNMPRRSTISCGGAVQREPWRKTFFMCILQKDTDKR